MGARRPAQRGARNRLQRQFNLTGLKERQRCHRRVLLVGARSARQGTGPFIAAALHRAGAQLCAIVGTSETSVNIAQGELLRDYGIDCRGYQDLLQALEREQPDAVVLCSPWQFHARQLALVAAAGCHCLVEKPLAWPASAAEVDKLISAFERSGLALQMVAQWPCTLTSFTALHGSLPSPLQQFTMRLSPISIGPDMVTDSAPHFLSMLQALLGPGLCSDVSLDFASADEAQQLVLGCQYQHSTGVASATLILATCKQRPRPAWYQIDGLRVDREVELPHYQQYFTAGQKRQALDDPMEQVVDKFLSDLSRTQVLQSTDVQTAGELLRAGHENLLRLAAAWPEGN